MVKAVKPKKAAKSGAISGATRKRIAEEMQKFPQKRGALLEALHLVQEELGCIAPETARELAEIFEMRAVEVMEVVSFYNMFHAAPQGRHHVHVCTNLPCSLRGGRSLLRRLEEHLGIRAGETTPDGRITLGREECLGACAYAPMLRIGDTYHENLGVELAKKLLDSLE
ncbi:MAG: NADH-quinone oxidoreductase subunit NuoE [Deltaproteobacteria bacterium]|nr:NADH-quinone oxidoreductase subunit NuoE [Deltaproteobacteria bacterium]